MIIDLPDTSTAALSKKLIHVRKPEFDISKIPLDDGQTYHMLAQGDTVGVFQLESSGMKDAVRQMRADRFEDLIALVALYRPGPMANIPTYCARKLGKEPIEYLHPKLEPILKETFGVITYQEQVQQIAKDMAGYTLAEADLLRRAMGKKIKSEMDDQRERFLTGATDQGVDRNIAIQIFEACAKFAEYGFNKSHSAPYAYISYQTAYLKANFPVEFLAASMTLDMGNTDKLQVFRDEAVRMGIKVAPPSVNDSAIDFSVREGKIFYSLAALKGVGGQAVVEGQRAVRHAMHAPDAAVADHADAEALNPAEEPDAGQKRCIAGDINAENHGAQHDERGIDHRQECNDKADIGPDHQRHFAERGYALDRKAPQLPAGEF